MKILFLCGSLEPGCDGVGDYTRRLGGELIKQGHHVFAIALNDTFIKNIVNETQRTNLIDLSVLRLPSNWSSKARFESAKKYIDVYAPDWISLQFVIFSFHLKGLPFGLANQLENIIKGYRLHIMFHELWVGQNTESTPKLFLWGLVQQKLIRLLAFKLKPLLIHTQSHLYQALLGKIGINSDYLPLFSNIPIIDQPSPETKGVFSLKSSKTVSFVVFGTIHPKAPVDLFAREAGNYIKEKGIRILLTFIGRSGKELIKWAAICESQNLIIKIMGEQSPKRISEVLMHSLAGISTTPLAQIEKSGTVAAMREHRLPIVCITQPWTPRGIQMMKIPDDILEYKTGNLENLICRMQKNASDYKGIDETSKQLTEDFFRKM